MRNEIGYGHLIESLQLRVAGCSRPARIDTRVTAVTEQDKALKVPLNVAPRSDAPTDHLEFALKHQGVDLEVIQAACLAIPAADVQSMITRTPNGRYARLIASLFEYFSGTELVGNPLSAPYVVLFDADRYVCGASRRQPKFRVDFNGLGDLGFCPVVRRTPALHALLDRNLFSDLEEFIESIGGSKNLDRALGWAYLDETRGSFAIEHEQPSDDKARRFVQLLHGAHDRVPLSEDYLAELQCATMTNPLLQELAFRRQQNWLQRGGRLTAANVTYMPPPPEMLLGLMEDLMGFANEPAEIDPLIKAFLVSFGFVFFHPFMDGNGRISRFLVHHSLCRSNMLTEGLILPISVAMKHHEGEYLSALQSVSKPIRDLWDITIIDESSIHGTYLGSGNPYRYWDATTAIEFGLKMAHYALDHSLIAETQYLKNFDLVRSRINARYDLLDKDLHALIRMAHGNQGTLSQNRRKQYALTVQPEAMDAIEQEVRDRFFSGDAE